MSVWTVVKTNLNDLSLIEEALIEIGFTVNKPSRNTIIEENVDEDTCLVIRRGKKGISSKLTGNILVSKAKNNSYSLSMRTEDNLNFGEYTLSQKIEQIYGVKSAIKQAKNAGCTIMSSTIESDGRVRIKAVVG